MSKLRISVGAAYDRQLLLEDIGKLLVEIDARATKAHLLDITSAHFELDEDEKRILTNAFTG